MIKYFKPIEAWEKIKHITSTREQGFDTELGEDYIYKEEVECIDESLEQLKELIEYFSLYEEMKKAFKILKEKGVDIGRLVYFSRYDYNRIYVEKAQLDEFEYKFLKRLFE